MSGKKYKIEKSTVQETLLIPFKRKIGAIIGATRQYDMACVCREYLKEHPRAFNTKR